MHFSIFATVIASILPVAGTQPNRQPALASTSRLTALVFGSGNSIWISTSKDDARHFSAPHEMAQAPRLALGRHRGPRVAISGSTLVVTAIYGATPDDPSKGDLVAWRSQDGGQPWTGPVVVNDVPGAAREDCMPFVRCRAGTNGIEVHEPGQKAPRSLSRSGAFPVMASLSNGSVVMAWEDNGRIETEIVH